MSINNVQSQSCSDVNMAVVVKENTDIDEYHSIFAKLKKLHDIAKTNEKESGEEGQSDENKLTSKRKTELDLDGLSDDSALNSSVNKNKRRRFSDSQDYSVRGDFNIRDYNDTSKKERKYILTLSNLPGEWTYEKIKQYVTKECGVDVLKMTDSRSQKSNYQLRLRFTNEEQYKSVLNKLRNKEVDGKLKLEIEDESDTDSGDSDTTMCIGKSEIKTEDTSWMSNVDVWDPEGVYGLKPEFLKNLNIVPPLVKWINVTNFRCDKSELRDVFEMAGRVVICAVVHTMNKYAKIMYSHPLEAVQAVSMLNGQTFYGQSLKVVMDPFAENALPLPKGLQNLGPGLGAMGKPLRDVVVEFERFVKGKDSTINASLFGKSDENVSEVSMERYSPSKPSSSEGFGQFGAIGQRKVLVTNSNAPNEPDHATSPRPGPSNVPTSTLGQNSPPMYPNPLATNLLGGRAFQQQPQNTPLLSSPPIEQYRYMGPQNFPSPYYGQAGQHNVPYTVPNSGQHQFPTGPNYQDPTGPKVHGPTPNFLGQCGQFGPNPIQHGQNFQNPVQLNVAHNPQFPMSNVRPNGQFMNQNVPMGPMSNMSGPSPGMVEPVQSCTNLGQRPNAPLPVPAPNMLTPVPPPRMTSGPFQGPNVLPQGPHELPLGSNGLNQGPNGPPQGMHGPFLGPNGPFQGPNGPNQGPNRPGQGQRNNSLPTVMVLKSKNPVALQITNLPEHVNFASLCGRLSKVGQVVSLDFTTPGCAIVKFDNPSEAERCFQYYSPSRYGHELGLI